MRSRVARFARGLERIAVLRVARVERLCAELLEIERQAAAQCAGEIERIEALRRLFGGPLRLDRASLFDLRRKGAILRGECAELRASIASLQADAARIRAEIDGERVAVTGLRRRQTRLLQWVDTRRKADRLEHEQKLQREHEEWVWRMWLS
jgi:hypothetical protein